MRSGAIWPLPPKASFGGTLKQPLKMIFGEAGLRLGEKFFQAIIASLPLMPVDMRALPGLKALTTGSRSLRMGPATGLSELREEEGAIHTVGRADDAARHGLRPAEGLQKKRYAKAALRKVQAVYPGLVLTYERGGITIHPSGLAVAQRQTKQVSN